LTADEYRFVQKIAAGARLKWRIFFAILALLWLVLLGGAGLLGWYGFSRFPISAVLIDAVILAVLGLMVFPMRKIWRASFLRTDSPLIEPLQGSFSILTIDSTEGTDTYPFIGKAEVYLPPGWLDYLHEGDVLHGHGYSMDAPNAYTEIKCIVLALDNGFSVDEEVKLGLLGLVSLGYWVTAFTTVLLWFIVSSIAAATSVEPIASYALWIPGVIACTLFALAAARANRNRPVRRQLDGLRKQLALAHAAAAQPASPTPPVVLAPNADSPPPVSSVLPGRRRSVRIGPPERKEEAPAAIPEAGVKPLGCLAVIGAAGLVLVGSAWLASEYGHVVYGGPLGTRCTQTNDCKSGTCVAADLGVGVCSRPCKQDSECDGLRCDGRFCVPRGNREVGIYCENPWDCMSLLCVRQGSSPGGFPKSDGVCGLKCEGENPCPDSATCVEIGVGEKICLER